MEPARDEPLVRRALEVCPASWPGGGWGRNAPGRCPREAVLRGYLSAVARAERHCGLVPYGWVPCGELRGSPRAGLRHVLACMGERCFASDFPVMRRI